MIINLLIWLFFGALTGWVASLLTDRNRGSRLVIYLLLGMTGAVIGGLLLRVLMDPSVTDVHLQSLLLSVPLSIIILGIFEFTSR